MSRPIRYRGWTGRTEVDEAASGSHLKQPRQVVTRMAVRVGGHVFGRSYTHHRAAASAPLGAHVNQPVGGFDDVDNVACIPRQ